LKGYDYSSPGAYFLTICTYQRQCLFGEIVKGIMQLNEFGQIAAAEWSRSSIIRQEIELHEWVIMPNHLHGIVIITPTNSTPTVGANGRSPSDRLPPDRLPLQMKSRSLSSLVAGFKSATTKRINLLRNSPGIPIWQRNYHEHIIRSQLSMQNIQQYIQNNPVLWKQDRFHPNNLVNQ